MDINLNSSGKINLNSQTGLDLYRQYKNYLIPVGVIVASILIVFFILLPQIQQLFNSEEILKRETEKLNVLKNNYNFLSSLPDETVNSNLNTLLLALPGNKDFAGIINEISAASAKSGVSVGDFNFQVGNLSVDKKEKSKYPFLQLTVKLNGNSKSVKNFVSEIYKTVPVAEVSSIKSKGNDATIIIYFYYKALPSGTISQENLISPLGAKEQALIDGVSLWNNASFSSASFLPFSEQASASADSSPF